MLLPFNQSGVSWLVTRFEAVGLDGHICAEYICSLREMHRSRGDRAAAITDFLSDCLATSSLPLNKRDQFVEDTIRQLEGDDVAPTGGPLLPSKSASSANGVGGFKRGIKITGTALREVVGNVKPTYTQRYSDDEEGGGVLRQVRNRGVLGTAAVSCRPEPMIAASPSNFPSLAGEAASKRPHRRQKARELGPDEDWGEPVIEREEVVKPPMETPPKSSPQKETTETTTRTQKQILKPLVVQPPENPNPAPVQPAAPVPVKIPNPPASFSALTVSPVLTNDQPLLNYHIPVNILNFDF